MALFRDTLTDTDAGTVDQSSTRVGGRPCLTRAAQDEARTPKL